MKALLIFIITISGLLSYSQVTIDGTNWGYVTLAQVEDTAAAIRADFPATTPGGNETDPVWISEKSGYVQTSSLGSLFAPYATMEWVGQQGYLTSLPAHGHTQTDVTGLVTALSGKAATSHGHPISEVTNLQTSLDGKASATSPILNGVDAQSSDTYVVTITGITAYTAGMMITFKAKTANTTACTININSLGAKSILKRVSTAMATGDILANQFCLLIYDGTNFIIINPTIN